MGRDFSVIKTNVGNNVGDTASTTLTLIGTYVNKRYFQILRSINWRYINEDYTITLVAGTQDYTLPTDFATEVYAVDVTDQNELAAVSLQTLAENYPGDLTTQGAVDRYTVFTKDDGSKIVRFHYVPSKAATVDFPYIVKPSALSADTDQPILDLEDIIETGATADLYRRKREFAKAKDMEVLFQQMLSEYVWEHINQKNVVHQFKPTVFNRDNLI